MQLVQNSPTSLRPAAWLMLAGQILYVGATLLHAGGEANHHQSIFAAYAQDQTWTAVHLGQFAAMAILISGVLALFLALDASRGPTLIARVGTAAAVSALALYGALQAVDGVALKQTVNAWANAPDADKAARFASAETIRWLEWGARSYHDFALGLTFVLSAVALLRAVPWPLVFLVGLTGLSYLAQGWVAGSEGFSSAQSLAIVIAWALSLAWMIWLALIAWRTSADAAQR
jgi:hypothetical protein